MSASKYEDQGIFAVYWETGENTFKIQTPTNMKSDTPDNIKKMIAQTLLDELGIGIRIELKGSK